MTYKFIFISTQSAIIKNIPFLYHLVKSHICTYVVTVENTGLHWNLRVDYADTEEILE